MGVSINMANIAKQAASGFLSLGSLLFVISSLFLFIGKNLFISGWTADHANITPLRWVSATVVPVIVVSWGHGRRSLSTSGALLALIVGFILTLAHYSFFLCLLAFFISSSKATKYKQEVKAEVEEDFKEGGQRNWLQVLCNGGMAFELSLLYLLDIGSSDLPVDSLIGASLQFSGKDAKTGKIVEVAREGVIPIAGKMVLDNHSVNLVSSILTALLLPKIALACGL